jgi:transcriptional regulator with XRE-family HTH domain
MYVMSQCQAKSGARRAIGEAVLDETIMSITAAAFGKRLKELRTKRGWSQQQLADRIGMGVAQINRYERGRSQPTLEAIQKLTTAFRISADELLFDKGTAGAAASILKGKLLPLFERISQFPDGDQEKIVFFLEAVIARADVMAALGAQPQKRAS